MNYRCPVCLYAELPFPPRDYHICPCCGTEFGNDDAESSHKELRDAWIGHGAPWFFGLPPLGWNPTQQMLNAGFFAFQGAADRLPVRIQFDRAAMIVSSGFGETADNSTFAIAA